MAGRGSGSRGGSTQEAVPSNIQVFFRMMTSWGNTMQRGNGGSSKVVEQFRKNQPLVFEGERDPLAAEEWISELESIFTYIDCLDAQKVTCATFMLKKGARHWWESARRAYDIANNPMGWDRFKEVFYDKYFPAPLKANKEAEFVQLTQGSMTVLEY
ncbi:hypothetical protein CerSpe_070090 [Prunus speciosa]